jgi:hypothetical protein
MPSFKVAHVREQGIDLIIVPVDQDFNFKPSSDQNAFISTLESRAHEAGLAGSVVPVWEASFGQMRFLAPPGWHPFFRGLSMRAVLIRLNKEVYW